MGWDMDTRTMVVGYYEDGMVSSASLKLMGWYIVYRMRSCEVQYAGGEKTEPKMQGG